MPRFMMFPLVFSFLGLLLVCLYRFSKTRDLRALITRIVILTVAGGLFAYLWYPAAGTIPKGDGDGWAFILILYVFMLLGMGASVGYNWFVQPREKRLEKKFDAALLLLPVFASPLVFIPLLAAFQDAQVDLKTAAPARLMTFLVAFQNGFFWKEFVDGKRKAVTASAEASPEAGKGKDAPK